MSSDEAQYQIAAQAELAGNGGHSDVSALGTSLLQEFSQAEMTRRLTEERWLQDLRQYRGQYDPDVEEKIGKNRSRAFVRKTRVKVKTTDSRVADLLFPAGSEKNWEVESTPVPTVPDDVKSDIIVKLTKANNGEPPPQEVIDKACAGVAKQAAKKMAKVIEDQLVEARYKQVSVQAIHSAHLYGTGVVKGPLVEKRVRIKFSQNKQSKRWELQNEEYVVPFLDFVPLWRFYPDMSATTIDQCRYVYELHRMTRHALSELAGRKSFDGKKIRDYITANAHGSVRLRYIDNQLKIIGDRTANQGDTGGQYEVLERWGWLTGEQLRNVGVEVEDDRLHEAFFSNVWMLIDGTVIKAALQPIDGVLWPYHLYYFDKDETSIFGEGLAKIMRDDQDMINAAVRMILDNGAITSGPMLEVNQHLLSPLTDITDVHPWKIWLRNQTQPGANAVRAIELPSKIAELSGIVNMFEQNADEVTAIPRYMTGENVSSGAAGTASGMSMLMGAANIVIKDLITSWDEGVTRPFITSLYRWNMRFHKDDAIKGDFDVKARGTASLVAKEVRARQLNEFGALVSNPLDAPYIKRHKLNLLRAEANELSDVVKTEDEVAAEMQTTEAQMQQQMQMKMQMASLGELEGKAAMAMANAKLQQMKAAETLANIDLIVAKSVGEKVKGIYAALQAAGVAVQSPMIAPAGDEILKSTGFRDATPDPAISQLMGQQVQGLLGGGQGQQIQPGQEMQPASPMIGANEGIETARLTDGAQ